MLLPNDASFTAREKEPRCGNNFIYLGTMVNVSTVGRANVYTKDDGLLTQTY